MIEASYYDSVDYEPPENFYDFSELIENYTYYYNDELYVTNYTVLTKALKEEEEPIPEAENILNLHPFKFYSMIVCICSILILISYTVSLHATYIILKRKLTVKAESIQLNSKGSFS